MSQAGLGAGLRGERSIWMSSDTGVIAVNSVPFWRGGLCQGCKAAGGDGFRLAEGRGANAGPSNALRSGRDDTFVVETDTLR